MRIEPADKTVKIYVDKIGLGQNYGIYTSSNGYAFSETRFSFKRKRDAVNFGTILSTITGLEFVKKKGYRQ